MLTFHLVFEAELHATVALDDYLIHQCHEHSQFKACTLFLFFQHMEEYLDAPPAFCLIFFLLSNGLNFLAEPCVLGEQRLVILFEYAASDPVMNHSFVFCKDNVQVEDGILYLPWYMAVFFKQEQLSEGLTYEVDLSGF